MGVRKYSHTGLGLGLLLLLMAVLLAILPSRAALLYRQPSFLALAGLEMPTPGPTASGPLPLREPEPPVGPRGSAALSPAPAVDPSPPEPSRSQAGAFTLDFGPFVTARDAEEVEKRLNQLGASAIRSRKRSGSALYTVRIGQFPAPAQARQAMKQLTLRHPTLPLGELEQEADGEVRVIVETRFPLREAVTLARQLRTEGFAVRIDTGRGAASLFTLRLAKTYDLKTAREKSQEFRDHGLPNAVVPVAPALSLSR